jgi:hypothetical protein
MEEEQHEGEEGMEERHSQPPNYSPPANHPSH